MQFSSTENRKEEGEGDEGVFGSDKDMISAGFYSEDANVDGIKTPQDEMVNVMSEMHELEPKMVRGDSNDELSHCFGPRV